VRHGPQQQAKRDDSICSYDAIFIVVVEIELNFCVLIVKICFLKIKKCSMEIWDKRKSKESEWRLLTFITE
jgi:hypothetical protein